MARKYDMISKILSLAVRLENLCEGFDSSNKSAVLTSRIKILIELSKKDSTTPRVLMSNVGLAKSNIAMLCNELVKEELISKKRDNFDTREISYSITEKGIEVLNNYFAKAQKNFEGELEYKNNIKQIEQSVSNLLELVN